MRTVVSWRCFLSASQSPSVAHLLGSGVASALQHCTRLASVMGRASPRTVEPCGRRPYNVAPVALHSPQPLHPSGCLLRGRKALHSCVSVGVCRPLHPHSCHLPITTRFPASSPPHSSSASLPLHLTYLVSSTSLPRCVSPLPIPLSLYLPLPSPPLPLPFWPATFCPGS